MRRHSNLVCNRNWYSIAICIAMIGLAWPMTTARGAGSDADLSSIISAIAINEGRIQTLEVHQTEYLLYDAPEGDPVQRKFTFQESGQSYHLKVEYPGMAYPPPPNTSSFTRPYVPLEVVSDGTKLSVLFPKSRQALILNAEDRNTMSLQSLPITSIRPWGDMDTRRFSEYLTSISGNPAYQVSIVPSEDLVTLKVTHADRDRQLIMELDPNRSFSPLRLASYEKNGALAHERQFSDYQLIDSVWIATVVDETHNSKNSSEKLTRQSRLESAQINSGLSPGTFDMKFPDMTRVVDRIKNVKWEVPMLTELSNREIAAIDSMPAVEVDKQPEIAPDNTKQDVSILPETAKPTSPSIADHNPWIMYVGIGGLIVLIAVAVIFKRWRRTERGQHLRTAGLVIMTLTGFACVIWASQRYWYDRPIIGVGHTEIQLGVIDSHAVVLHQIQIRNHGNQPLVIQEVKRACGCMDISIDNRTILPGTFATVNVEYHPTANISQEVDQSLLIISNDEAHSPTQIRFRGKTVVGLRVEPTEMHVGPVRRGSSTQATIRILNGNNTKVASPSLGAIVAPGVSIIKSEPITESDGQIGQSITVSISPPDQLGGWKKELRIPTGVKSAPNVNVVVHGLTNEQVNLRPGIALLTKDGVNVAVIHLNGLPFSKFQDRFLKVEPADALTTEWIADLDDPHSSILKLRTGKRDVPTNGLSGNVYVGSPVAAVIPFKVTDTSERKGGND